MGIVFLFPAKKGHIWPKVLRKRGRCGKITPAYRCKTARFTRVCAAQVARRGARGGKREGHGWLWGRREKWKESGCRDSVAEDEKDRGCGARGGKRESHGWLRGRGMENGKVVAVWAGAENGKMVAAGFRRREMVGARLPGFGGLGKGGWGMDASTVFFFDGHLGALPLYERLEEQILAKIPGVRVRTAKTQITFANRYGFAFVSFLPVRKAACRPEIYLTVSFGLGYRKDSPRIDAATEPYPNRWTHHVMVCDAGQIDEELLGWIQEAAAFSAEKGRNSRRGCRKDG